MRRAQDSNLQGIAPAGFQDRCISRSANPPFTVILILTLAFLVLFYKTILELLLSLHSYMPHNKPALMVFFV